MKLVPLKAEILESNPATTPEQKIDLDHFLKLAAAQVRHRIKINTKNSESDSSQAKIVRTLQLLEDLIKEQGQANENSRSAISPTR
jgi:hypothetical protein